MIYLTCKVNVHSNGVLRIIGVTQPAVNRVIHRCIQRFAKYPLVDNKSISEKDAKDDTGSNVPSADDLFYELNKITSPEIEFSHLSIAGKLSTVRRADCLLQQLELASTERLSHRQYVAIIKAWLELGDVDNATRVLRMSVEMHSKSSHSTAPSPAIIYKVIKAFVQWDLEVHLIRATQLAQELHQLRKEQRLPDGPDLRTFRLLISAWKQSNHPERIAYIRSLWKYLAELAASKHNGFFAKLTHKKMYNESKKS
jgi:hypothetical protein